MKLEKYIRRQIRWSEQTFGPGPRSEGLCNHIKKELDEIKQDPKDIYE